MRKTLSLIVTERCNMRCRYCYVEKSPRSMSIEIARAAIDLALGDRRWRCDGDGIVVECIGGEPLIEADLITELGHHMHARLHGDPWERNHAISITSNGLLYDTLPVQRMLASHRCVSISITVDGDRESHDAMRVDADGGPTYDRVARNMRLWLRQFPAMTTSTKFTLTPAIMPRLSTAIMSLFQLGVPQVHANPAFEIAWTDEDARAYEEQLVELGRAMTRANIPRDRCSLLGPGIGYPVPGRESGIWCGTGRWMLAVGVDGALYPCNRFAPSGLRARSAITCGHVSTGIDYAVLERFMTLTRQTQCPPECLTCDIASGCAWCTAHGYDETGAIERKSMSICIMHHARVRAIRRLAEEDRR